MISVRRYFHILSNFPSVLSFLSNIIPNQDIVVVYSFMQAAQLSCLLRQ